MMEAGKRKPSFKAGVYLLENLTSGMYTDPFAILREYVQNGVDSIDLTTDKGPADQLEIKIELDPGERQIFIRDNGQGIPAAYAEEVLSSIGSSNKTTPNLRGFRGIGRLGGIAFSDMAVFKTKAAGENVESVQEWDCKSLRKLLAENKNRSMTFDQVFQNITTFSQNRCKRSLESFFEVTLYGISSFRNYIFDITRARRYLSQVAPVPFHPDDFSFAHEVDNYLERNLKHYQKYNIVLNDDRIFKPYKDKVKITKGGFDKITEIKFIDLCDANGELTAYGWYGEREELLGSIIKGDDSSGIRVRVGNIMIGDDHLLDSCFREPRFSSYAVGEVHIECNELIPNSRRDDFIDNGTKNVFYNVVEKEIGLPISKEIRLKSRIKSGSRSPIVPSKKEEGGVNKSHLVVSEAKSKREDISGNETRKESESIFNEILKTCKGCPKLTKIIGEICDPKNISSKAITQ
jgi:hypothetical protein